MLEGDYEVGHGEAGREESDQEQAVTQHFFESFGKEIKTLAAGLDFSGSGASELVEINQLATSGIEELRREVFSDMPEVFAAIRGDADAVKRLSQTLWSGLDLLKDLLAMRQALDVEVGKRFTRNKVNYHFGSLVLAQASGYYEAQEWAFGQLLGILLSIPSKKGWFLRDRAEWIGVIHEVLAKQLSNFSALTPNEVLLRMMDNGFAFIYTAVEFRMADTLRKLYQRRRVVSSRAADFFDSVPESQAELERLENSIQREGLIRVVQNARRGVKGVTGGVLSVLETYLAEVEHLEEKSSRDVRAWFVERLSEYREVSKQQARRDLKKFEKEQVSEALAQVRDALRVSVPREPIRITFRESRDETQ